MVGLSVFITLSVVYLGPQINSILVSILLSPVLYAGPRSGRIDSGSVLTHASAASRSAFSLRNSAFRSGIPGCTRFHIVVKPRCETTGRLTDLVDYGRIRTLSTAKRAVPKGFRTTTHKVCDDRAPRWQLESTLAIILRWTIRENNAKAAAF
jgi:hypothetical protein